MGKVDTYRLRQGILREMKGLDRAPVKADEARRLAADAACRVAPEDQFLEEFAELARMGFLGPVPGFGGLYFRITGKGLEQLAPEYPQDPFVWGPGAVR